MILDEKYIKAALPHCAKGRFPFLHFAPNGGGKGSVVATDGVTCIVVSIDDWVGPDTPFEVAIEDLKGIPTEEPVDISVMDNTVYIATKTSIISVPNWSGLKYPVRRYDEILPKGPGTWSDTPAGPLDIKVLSRSLDTLKVLDQHTISFINHDPVVEVIVHDPNVKMYLVPVKL